MALRRGMLPASGTFNGVTATSTVGMTTVPLGPDLRKIDDLAVQFTVLAETNTITLSLKWQGSLDGTNWLDIAHAPQNPAAVVLATGTAGADVAVTRLASPPGSAYAFRFVRAAFVVGVTTGAAGDTYSASYRWREIVNA